MATERESDAGRDSGVIGDQKNLTVMAIVRRNEVWDRHAMNHRDFGQTMRNVVMLATEWRAIVMTPWAPAGCRIVRSCRGRRRGPPPARFCFRISVIIETRDIA